MTRAVKDDVEKYIVKRKRADKTFAKGFEAGDTNMKAHLLNDLRQSVKEAVAIQRGELKPSRGFKVRKPNAPTRRTLKSSQAGKRVKPFRTKKELFTDLGL